MSDPAALLADLRTRVDDVLLAFLEDRRGDLAAMHPDAVVLVDEIERLVRAGGQRLRPAFTYWGYRAAGGPDDEAIVRAGAAVELLHTMALVHDDLIDATPERRGVPASHVAVGPAVAVLVGDLAAVLADELLLRAGVAPERLLAAQARYHRMRIEMAAGELIDVTGAEADPHHAAGLKGGGYTVVGPLLLGADLAGGGARVLQALWAFGEPLGRAFQLLDDLRDGDAAPGVTADEARALVGRSLEALVPGDVDPRAVEALAALARAVEALA